MTVSPQKRFYIALFLISTVLLFFVAARQTMPVPDNDSVDYLGYARSLYLAGTYAATPAGPQIDPGPGREPLYSATIAVLGRVVHPLGRALAECDVPATRCLAGYRVLPFFNAILLATAAILAALTVAALGGGRAATTFAWAYVTFNFQLYKNLKYVISDYLSMALVGLVATLLVLAIRKTADPRRWLALGLALSALALSKHLFLPYAAILTAGLALVGLIHLRQDGVRALMPACLLALMLVVVNGTWMARNLAIFKSATDARGAVALSTREVFDHMTPGEHLAAYLWWMRGPGAGLARTLLPQEDWARHEWYAPEGFYMQGQFNRPEARIAALMQAGLTRAEAEKRAASVVLEEILDRWPQYVASMPALIYRGLWVDEYIVLGFPLLLYALWQGLRRRRYALLAALSPGIWSLCLYPALSVNIPRYQMTALGALAIAAAWGAERLVSRYHRIRHGAG